LLKINSKSVEEHLFGLCGEFVILTILLLLIFSQGCGNGANSPGSPGQTIPPSPAPSGASVETKTTSMPSETVKNDNLNMNGTGNQDKPADKNTEAGNKYLENKQYDKAMESFEAAIRENPNSAIGYIGKGRVFAEMKKNEEALAEFQKAVDKEPGNAISWVNRGNGYSRMRKFDLAIADYEKAISIDPANYMGYFNRGKAVLRSTVNLQKRDFERVLVDFDKAASLQARIDEIFVERGTVYRQMGLYEKAEKDLKKALVLRNSAAAHCELAQVYMDMDRQDAALKHLNDAISIDPEFRRDPYFADPTNSINGYLSRGLIYSDRGEYARAVADFEKALKVKPSDKKTYIEMALAKSYTGRKIEAKTDAEKWLLQDPKGKHPVSAEDYIYTGSAYVIAGDIKKGIECLNKSIEMDDTAGARLERGRAFLEKGDYGKAKTDLEKVISGDSEDREKALARSLLEKCK